MKTKVNTTVATVTPAIVTETIRPLSTLETLLSISGDKVSIPKGCDISPAELGAFIADRDEKARTYGSQARWTWHAIGALPDAEAKRAEVRKALEGKLSKSALYQLTSEAETLCPLIERENIAAPLSLLKDAKAELLVDEKTGRLAPMAKQTKAGRELIPLLKAGNVTQKGIRDIRAKHKPATVTPPKPKGGTPSGDAKEAAAFGLALGQAKAVQTYLTSVKLEGADRQQFVNIATDIARQLGLNIAN